MSDAYSGISYLPEWEPGQNPLRNSMIPPEIDGEGDKLKRLDSVVLRAMK